MLSVYVLMYLYFEQQTDNSYEAIQFMSIVDVIHLTSPESINILTMQIHSVGHVLGLSKDMLMTAYHEANVKLIHYT
jgi:hypothetical protein